MPSESKAPKQTLDDLIRQFRPARKKKAVVLEMSKDIIRFRREGYSWEHIAKAVNQHESAYGMNIPWTYIATICRELIQKEERGTPVRPRKTTPDLTAINRARSEVFPQEQGTEQSRIG